MIEDCKCADCVIGKLFNKTLSDLKNDPTHSQWTTQEWHTRLALPIEAECAKLKDVLEYKVVLDDSNNPPALRADSRIGLDVFLLVKNEDGVSEPETHHIHRTPRIDV